MNEAAFLYSTAPDETTARRIASALVEARLAACANLFPGMVSIYRWEGAIETGNEVAVIFKTVPAAAEEACAMIRRLHPYETPCVVALQIDPVGSNPAFLDWIAAETKK